MCKQVKTFHSNTKELVIRATNWQLSYLYQLRRFPRKNFVVHFSYVYCSKSRPYTRLAFKRKCTVVKAPGVVTCTCNPAALKAEFQNGVGSVPVGGNSLSIGEGIVRPPVIRHKETSLTKSGELTEA